MTIEDKARECAARICGAGDVWDEVVKGIESALREQIEECAQVAEIVRKRELEMYTGRIAYHTIAEEIRDRIYALDPPAVNPPALPAGVTLA